MLLTVSILGMCGILLLAADFVRSQTELDVGIERNVYGKGDVEREINVKAKSGQKEKIRIKVSERSYTQEEIERMFQRCISKLERLILGKNSSLDHVEEDLNLVTVLQEEPVEIAWELDRYDVMNIYGELQSDELKKEGTLVTLQAVLTYTEDRKRQARYEYAAAVFPKTRNKKEKLIDSIQKAIKNRDKETQTRERFFFPEKVEGQKVSYYPVMEQRGAVLLVMAILIGSLIAALEKQEKMQEQNRIEAQMKLDYPEILSKLALLLGAGMTIKRAWRKIVTDYDWGKERWGERYAYEQMRQACHEMDSGVTEAESYERFGRRCGQKEYIKLGALLSQNLRKGTKDLNRILRTEAEQSLEERKARAKRLGEEAGTKLLAPMFLMLAEVLMVVIIPAFLSLQTGG